MKLTSLLSSSLAIAGSLVAAANSSKPVSSKQILPSNFKPPQVFENVNLVRNVNLDKGYPRETINLVVRNVDAKPQSDYYIPFEADLMSRIGGFEVRNKKDASQPPFEVEATGLDSERYLVHRRNMRNRMLINHSATEFYLVHLPKALEPKAEMTLSITFNVLSALSPLPETIEQMAQQTVVYKTSAYAPSAYLTLKQKTKFKFPTTNIPDYTVIPNKNAEGGSEDPTKQGSSFTYGPYEKVPGGAVQDISIRYEFTKPLIHATRLERDIEVSHWGGNLATEERYWLGNRAAQLKDHFSRVKWQVQQYSNPPTTALKELKLPLHVGSVDAYFTDDIGNVSTSRFRSNSREALLELKPRYPVFGGWKYSFRVGWNAGLENYLHKLKIGDSYVLKVPFVEGPKMSEGVEYEKVEVRVILPEGAQ
jgi:oligosaccharyltransferase complex subunit alpha (ribophorin I)